MSEHPFSDWVLERPEAVRLLMIDWPPEARVRTRPGEVLMVPAPGVEGRVASWFESGTVGIEAPLVRTEITPSGETLPAGTVLRAECDPAKLEIVGFATYGDTRIDHDLIRSLVKPQRAVVDGILDRHGETRTTLEEAGLDDLPSDGEG